MKRRTLFAKIVVAATLVSALLPGAALATNVSYEPAVAELALSSTDADPEEQGAASDNSSSLLTSIQANLKQAAKEHAANVRPQGVRAVMARVAQARAEFTDKVLSYDPAHIAAIGTQVQTGHSVCCPSFSCAYADAVLDGTVHDHFYYSCTTCRWTDWGGGNSSFRCVGTNEQLLRETYDQIHAGKPTVMHVRASYGEHWIAVIGYAGAADPDHLALSNFIALDPWDGAQINAAERFSLYGDGCEHISDR